MPTERIQKVLAAAGFGSRRACESLVEKGRVSVNGKTVRELPLLVDPAKDKVNVDRKPIRSEKLVYYLLHKPRGVFCTHNDPAGRKRAIDLMTGVRERVFPVGRLDADSMGLLIMTNDGELTQKLTHPSFQAPKTYRVEVKGCPKPEALQKLRQGVWLSEGRTQPATVKLIRKEREKAILEITLREGRNREIRRMLAKLSYRVRRLTRIRMGKLSIRKLSSGAFRPLTKSEVQYLYRLTSDPPDRSAKQRSTVPKGRASRKPSENRVKKNRKDTEATVREKAVHAARRRRIILPKE